MAIFGLRLGANHDERIYDDSLWSREFCVKGFRCLLLVFCDFQARKQVLNHARKRLNSSTVYSHKFLKSVSQSRNEYEADKQIVPSKTKRKQKPFFFFLSKTGSKRRGQETIRSQADSPKQTGFPQMGQQLTMAAAGSRRDPGNMLTLRDA